MRTITGLFDSYEHATQAVHALHDAGINSTDIGIVANHTDAVDDEPDDIAEGATTGAEIGAGLGAAGGLLAGLGLIAIPGIGPVLAGGWLFAAAMGALAGAGVGAATGGLVGALTGAGVPEADAEVYAEAVRRGGTLVTAHVDDSRADAAALIIRHANGVDIVERRRNYKDEGWERFDETAEPPAPGQGRDSRDRYPPIPPLF